MQRRVLSIRKTIYSSLLVAILVTGSLFINWGEASKGSANSTKVKQLESQIAELKKKQQEAKQNIQKINQEKQRLENEESKLYQEIETIDLQLTETELKVTKKENEVSETEERAYQAALELKEAEEKIDVQDDLLKTRVRSMYEFGDATNYLDVLFGATNFSDLLNRIEFLTLVRQQDQKIINQYVANKEVIEEKKLQIEELLVKLEGQLVELNQMQENLREQEKKKSLRIAEINKVQEDLAAQEEEEAQLAIQFANQIAAKNKEIENLQFDGKFLWPVPDSKRITSNFGFRSDPFTGARKGHRGTDIGAPEGTKIVAASGGIVIVAEYLRGYGNTVIIEHGDNIRTLYAHIRNGGIKVKVGDKVAKGDKIAEVGSTGRSTGPHLHFEVHENGTQVDPMKYLKK
ncbi:murein hydrolase activator EnvC family protein [Caldalkalibacillus mannanilyticus]|uniref:murein hydrolase activator EnvC family protein n=1 Tax=Caldalkalibacillus mannanilyticus TaxID=1418 RepID=UPI0004684111|nr:M23 family metallopeptidase [Caldalkalibacillus mannanilyticus]